jgi:hypothetical protein
MTKTKKVDPRLDKIAKVVFEDDGLEVKNSDRLDFTEVSKWTLRRMLEEAYALGVKDGRLA